MSEFPVLRRPCCGMAAPDICKNPRIKSATCTVTVSADTSLAGVLDAPVILVSENTVESAIETMQELGVTDVYIVGGTSSVSESIEEKIGEAGISTERLAGKNRQETALAIANEVLSIMGDNVSDTCIIAAGATFPDALAGAALCGQKGSVLLLSGTDVSKSSKLISVLQTNTSEISYLYIFGGTSSVSSDIRSAIKSALDED